MSDLLDGPLARRLGTVSARGRLLDHTADFATVSGALFAAAARGAVPILLPLLICVAFVQYVLDSKGFQRGHELRMSGLGRWNGILYFFPICGEILGRLGLDFLFGPVRWLSWLLVATTLLSLVDRLRPLRRTTLDSRAAKTLDRSGR